MNGRGRCRDNAKMERFWWALKYEDIKIKDYASLPQLRFGVQHYVNFYNSQRIHSALQYKTPDEIYFGTCNSTNTGYLVADKLRGMKLDSVAKFVEDSVEETLSYMDFPYEHWLKIRTNNGLERIMKEIRRRTRVVGSFPDGYSAMMLVGARLRHISTTKWGTRQYLCTCKIYEQGVI